MQLLCMRLLCIVSCHFQLVEDAASVGLSAMCCGHTVPDCSVQHLLLTELLSTAERQSNLSGFCCAEAFFLFLLR